LLQYQGYVTASDIYPQVEFTTTKGSFIVEVVPEWAPIGAKHFLELVENGFYTDIAFYRSVDRFLTQFGISENPKLKHWHYKQIEDDVPLQPHRSIDKHIISYAGGGMGIHLILYFVYDTIYIYVYTYRSPHINIYLYIYTYISPHIYIHIGPNTRSTQLFISYEYLDFLGKEPWEIPFGRVVEGHDVVGSLYKGYGDIPPFGDGPDQQAIFSQGNGYVRRNFPHVDFIQHCKILNMDVAQRCFDTNTDSDTDTDTVNHATQIPSTLPIQSGIGVGTAGLREKTYKVVCDSLRSGFTLIDTAQAPEVSAVLYVSYIYIYEFVDL